MRLLSLPQTARFPIHNDHDFIEVHSGDISTWIKKPKLQKGKKADALLGENLAMSAGKKPRPEPRISAWEYPQYIYLNYSISP